MPKTEQSNWGPHPESDSEELTMWIRVTSSSMSAVLDDQPVIAVGVLGLPEAAGPSMTGA